MKKSSVQHELELATGTETIVHPKTPSDADSMALAIKGNKIFSFSPITLLQRCWTLAR